MELEDCAAIAAERAFISGLSSMVVGRQIFSSIVSALGVVERSSLLGCAVSEQHWMWDCVGTGGSDGPVKDESIGGSDPVEDESIGCMMDAGA